MDKKIHYAPDGAISVADRERLDAAIVTAAVRFINWPTVEDEKELADNPDWDKDIWFNDGYERLHNDLVAAVRAAARIIP